MFNLILELQLRQNESIDEQHLVSGEFLPIFIGDHYLNLFFNIDCDLCYIFIEEKGVMVVNLVACENGL